MSIEEFKDDAHRLDPESRAWNRKRALKTTTKAIFRGIPLTNGFIQITFFGLTSVCKKCAYLSQ